MFETNSSVFWTGMIRPAASPRQPKNGRRRLYLPIVKLVEGTATIIDTWCVDVDENGCTRIEACKWEDKLIKKGMKKEDTFCSANNPPSASL